MRRAWLALLATLLAAPVAAQMAGPAWVYPTETIRDAAGREVFPTTDGRQFGSAMEREAYLRQTRHLRRQVGQAADAARRDRRAAGNVGRGPALPELPPRVIRREPTELNPSGYRRALREDSRVRLQAQQQAWQDYLGQGGRSDAANMRSELSTARLGRARQVATGMDRLYSGAAAARATLGERETRPIGPLIRTPRIGE